MDETQPLLLQDADKPLLTVSEHKPTRWTSSPKKVRYVIIPPHHLLAWIRDNIPTSPVPKDAIFHALGVDAKENFVTLEFHSILSPGANALFLKMDELSAILKDVLRHHLPTDAQVTSIYLSGVWAHMMIVVASDRFPELKLDVMPMIQVRYEGGQLYISNQSQPENDTERIAVCGR